ncbi:MAG TPA: anthranilate phosphoribosyltransferase [Spirochaetes bacterium]|nr:anthranilate phosphoribosyltransferase [Spirochaetota bacterium]
MNIQNCIKELHEGVTLPEDRSLELFNAIFAGEVNEVRLASILTALSVRGETSQEIVGAALSMRSFATKLPISDNGFFDTCGTGGDHSHSFNISTAVALILCSMGVPMAKHGNRSMTSKSGSADFLEALGVPIGLSGDEAAAYFRRHGFIFLYAPNYHPAMKHAVPVRRALGVRTIFNFLGPLTNPLAPKRQVVGVFHPRHLPLYARAAACLPYERILVYSADSGMDEVSPVEPTHVVDVHGGTERSFSIDPDAYITPAEAAGLPFQNSAEENAAAFMETIMSAEPTPLGKLLALNTALALYALNGEEGFARRYGRALDLVHSGQVARKVNEMREAAR